jgi:hypothetical protein
MLQGAGGGTACGCVGGEQQGVACFFVLKMIAKVCVDDGQAARDLVMSHVWSTCQKAHRRPLSRLNAKIESTYQYLSMLWCLMSKRSTAGDGFSHGYSILNHFSVL